MDLSGTLIKERTSVLQVRTSSGTTSNTDFQQLSDVSVSSGISFRFGGGELLCACDAQAPRHRTSLEDVSLPPGIMVFPNALKNNSTNLTLSEVMCAKIDCNWLLTVQKHNIENYIKHDKKWCITVRVCSLWFALLYLVLSKSIFSHVVLPLDLYLHLLRDVRDHYVNQTTNEENYMLRGEDQECLCIVTAATETTALIRLFLSEHEITLMCETLTSKTMTKLSCMARRWKNSGRYSPFSSLKPWYLPRTTTTTLCCNVIGWERPVKHVKLHVKWSHPVACVLQLLPVVAVIFPTCRRCSGVAGYSCVVMLPEWSW